MWPGEFLLVSFFKIPLKTKMTCLKIHENVHFLIENIHRRIHGGFSSQSLVCFLWGVLQKMGILRSTPIGQPCNMSEDEEYIGKDTASSPEV